MRVALLLACCTAAHATVRLSDWMGDLYPVIADKTLLDLSVPGTHDTMTYDLSDIVSDNDYDMSRAMAAFLHDFSHILPSVPNFIREQAKSQDWSIVDQLNGGVRFIDFRIIYSRGPRSIIGGHDWYNLHLVESNEKATTYLQQVKAWLDQHPKEIVTFWWSRHGDCTENQFDGISDADMQHFMDEALSIFGNMVWDTSKSHANTTTVAELLQRNHRVLLYVAESQRFLGNRTLGYDACLIDNELSADVTNVSAAVSQWEAAFSSATRALAADKKKNMYYLHGMASSSPGFQIEGAAKRKYLFDKHAERECAKKFNIPNLTDWCPPELISLARLTNYYGQIALEHAIRNWPTSRFPNAIYLDDVSSSGAMMTGESDTASQGYAYSATVILSNVWNACGGPSGTRYAECRQLSADLQTLRAQHPFKTWNDNHGRTVGWPASP